LLVLSMLLIVRRFFVSYLRQINNLEDIFALVLLLSIIGSGLAMRLGPHFDLTKTRIWFQGLLTFSPEVPMNGVFLLHLLLVQILLIYLPFSKLLHSVGGILNQTYINRR